MPAPVTEGQRQRFESLGGDWGRLRSVQFYRSQRDPTWVALSRLEQRQRRKLLEEAGYGISAIDEVEAGLAKVFPQMLSSSSLPRPEPQAVKRLTPGIDTTWPGQRPSPRPGWFQRAMTGILGTEDNPTFLTERGGPLEALSRAFDPLAENVLQVPTALRTGIMRAAGDPNAPERITFTNPFDAPRLQRQFAERPLAEQIIGGAVTPGMAVSAGRAAVAAGTRLPAGVQGARRLGLEVLQNEAGAIRPSGFLPRELSGAKSRFNVGAKQYIPQFESDVDKALFTVGQATKNKADSKYMEWLRTQFPDASDSAIRAMGRELRKKVRPFLDAAEPGDVAIPATMGEARPPEVSVAIVLQKALEEASPRSLDDIVKATGIPKIEASSELAMMELRGEIRQVSSLPSYALSERAPGTPGEAPHTMDSLSAAPPQLQPPAEVTPGVTPVWGETFRSRLEYLDSLSPEEKIVVAEALFDSTNVDLIYKKAMSTGTRRLLKKGETWRSRLERFASYEDIDALETAGKVTHEEALVLKAQVRAGKTASTPPPAALTQPHPPAEVAPGVPAQAPNQGAGIPGGAPPAPRVPFYQRGAPPPFQMPVPPGRYPPGQVPPAPPLDVPPAPVPSGRGGGGVKVAKAPPEGSAYQKLKEGITPKPETLKQKVRNVMASVHRGAFTPNAPLKRLPESSLGSPYDLARIVAASSSKGQEILRSEYLPVLKPVGNNLRELEQYKVLQRSDELLSGPKPIVNLPGGLNRSDLQKAHQALKEKLGPELYGRIAKASDQLDVLNQHWSVDLLRENGLLSKRQAMALKTDHRRYMPFTRDDFVLDIENRMGLSPASVSGAGLKRLTETGSERTLSEPLARLLAQPGRVQNVIARNNAAKGLVESLQSLETTAGELVTFANPPSLARNANISGMTKPSLAAVENSKTSGTISFLIDGEVHQAVIPREWARIAQNLDTEANATFNTVMRNLTNPFRAAVTTYNPSYALKNLLRDATSFLFNGGLIPFGPTYMRGLKAVLSKDELYQEAARSGTLMSGLVDKMESIDQVSKAMRNRLENGAFNIRSQKDVALLVPRLVRNVGRGIKEANIAIEQTPRVAAFEAARTKGATSLQAAIKGRDITVDFAQHGTVMRTVDAIFPFSNAATQGLYITAQTIKKHPIRSAAIASAFMVPTIISRVNNMARFPETSGKIPDYAYQYAWIVQFGEFTDENGERMPLYFKIPKGPLAGPATFMAEVLFSLARPTEDRSAVDLMIEGAKGALTTLSPVDPSGGLAPPVGTILELGANYDFFRNAPIVSRSQALRPPEEQFGARTPRAAVAVGRALRVSPEKISFGLADYFGGAGQAVNYGLDKALGGAGYKPVVFGSELQQEVASVTQLSRAPVIAAVVGARGNQLDRVAFDQLNKSVEAGNRRFNEIPEMLALGVRLGSVGNSMDTTPGVAGGVVELKPAQQNAYQVIMADIVIEGMENYQAKAVTAEEKKQEIQRRMGVLKEVARGVFFRTITADEVPTPQQFSAWKQEALDWTNFYRQIPFFKTLKPIDIQMYEEGKEAKRGGTEAFNQWNDKQSYYSNKLLVSRSIKNLDARVDDAKLEYRQQLVNWQFDDYVARFEGSVPVQPKSQAAAVRRLMEGAAYPGQDLTVLNSGLGNRINPDDVQRLVDAGIDSLEKLANTGIYTLRRITGHEVDTIRRKWGWKTQAQAILKELE